MKLKGRTAIITGGSQGLGAAIAEKFVAEGASVLICARDKTVLEATRSHLSALARAGQQVIAQVTDVAVHDEVEALVERALSAFSRLDILVNNAGVYGPLGPIEEVDWNAWTAALNVNVLGTVYPCRAVLPAMRRQRYGKIINLSGGGATNPLPRITAYAASKAAVVRFSESLALEVRDAGIDVNSIAPGALATRLLDQVVEAGPDVVGADFHARMARIQAEGGTPLAKGADLCVYLASAKSDGITGRLLSAVWDPWPQLHQHRAELGGSDIYTLRRIVPEDRGKKWG